MRPREAGAPTAGDVLRALFTRPRERLVRRWNWKSALLSSVVRASLFFVTNLPAGRSAARSAAVAELLFRGSTSGFYGAITEAFVPARPARTAMLTASVFLAVISHTLEFLLHYSRGTPRLLSSIIVSAAFTIVSTAFNLFAMRQGVFIVGEGRRSIAADLARIPALMGLFVSHAFRRARTVHDPCR
jgi:hypothetical protein